MYKRQPCDEVEKILPTENFLVIIARRDPILALRTDSFIEGDWGSFHSFMAEKMCIRDRTITIIFVLSVMRLLSSSMSI